MKLAMLKLFYIQLISVTTMNIAIEREGDVLHYTLNIVIYFSYILIQYPSEEYLDIE